MLDNTVALIIAFILGYAAGRIVKFVSLAFEIDKLEDQNLHLRGLLAKYLSGRGAGEIDD